MKKKSIITMGALFLAIAGSGWARTWTSADGKSTFEGDYVSATDTKVTVKRENGTITFDINKLSSDGQEFVKKAAAEAAATAAARAKYEKLKSLPVPKAIGDKLLKLDGEKLVQAPESYVVPEYYFLAYTASW